MSDRWKALVIISLVLNLFLAGALVGAWVVGARFLGERAEVSRGEGGRRMNQAFAALSPERREALRQIMRAQALSAGPDMRTAREARREVAQLISAEPYDAAAVSAALTRAREAEGRARARIDATLAERLGQLSPEERAQFSRLVGRGGVFIMRRENRGGRDGRDGPDRPFRDGPPPPPLPPLPD